MRNAGRNACFVNATVQLLCTLAPLRDCLLSATYVQMLRRAGVLLHATVLGPAPSEHLVSFYFALLVSDLWAPDGPLPPRNASRLPPTAPRAVDNRPFMASFLREARLAQFADGDQHDAQEFATCLIDVVHEELANLTARASAPHGSVSAATPTAAATSCITDALRGQLVSTVRCDACGHTSVTYDTYTQLSLDIAQPPYADDDTAAAAAATDDDDDDYNQHRGSESGGSDAPVELQELTVYIVQPWPNARSHAVRTLVDPGRTVAQLCDDYRRDSALIGHAVELAPVQASGDGGGEDDEDAIARLCDPDEPLGEIFTRATAPPRLCLYYAYTAEATDGGHWHSTAGETVDVYTRSHVYDSSGPEVDAHGVAGTPVGISLHTRLSAHCTGAQLYEGVGRRMGNACANAWFHIVQAKIVPAAAATTAAVPSGADYARIFTLYAFSSGGAEVRKVDSSSRARAFALGETAVQVSAVWNVTRWAPPDTGSHYAMYMRARLWLADVVDTAKFKHVDDRYDAHMRATQRDDRAAAAAAAACQPEEPPRSYELRDLLARYVRTERLTGSNRYRCHSTACGGAELRTATKRIELGGCPPYLLVTLKRFEFDMYGAALSKITAPVHCELDDLDIAPALARGADAPPLDEHGLPPSVYYRLAGWTEHIGATARGGHYVAARVVRNVRTGAAARIVHYDDERVRVERACVDGAGMCPPAANAYMLCYERV